MTNGEIYKDCTDKYDLPILDYRPLYSMFVNGKEGITLFMDNGDIFMYFPNQSERREE